MNEIIRPEDMAALRDAVARAELAAKDAEIVKLRLFIRYGLTGSDSFDIGTGIITRMPSAPPDDTGGPNG